MPRYRTALALAAAAVLVPALSFGLAGRASADTTHVVARGHTIETIAHRYHVTVKAIVDANHLKDPKHLKPGEVLVIPGVHGTAHAAPAHGAVHGQPAHASANATPAAAPTHDHEDAPRAAHAAEPPAARGASFEATPRQPDVVHASRFNEDFAIRVKDRRGKIPPPALHQFERLMSSGSAEHDVDPRLIALLGIVSNHFGGRKLEIVSGYRPYSPTQYTTHSNHNQGRALDFRIQGVPNEVLRDFCHTLHNVGVGYYPNSTFVHLDVREAPATWTDYSRPGEPPRYDRATPNADESSSDVPDDAPQAVSAASAPAPSGSPVTAVAPAH